MTSGKVLYTDGHQVTITDSMFQVKKNTYRLDGIIRHSSIVIPPRRVPVLLGIMVGLIFLTLGVFDYIPAHLIPNLTIAELVISTRVLAIIFGAAMLSASIAFLFIEKEKYGVHILTAEGEKAVVVSKEREYVEMISEALSKALERWRF